MEKGLKRQKYLRVTKLRKTADPNMFLGYFHNIFNFPRCIETPQHWDMFSDQ